MELGRAFAQFQNVVERVIAYVSRRLREANYLTGEEVPSESMDLLEIEAKFNDETERFLMT